MGPFPVQSHAYFFPLMRDVVLLTTETWVLLNFSSPAGNFLLFFWGILVWTGIALTKRSLKGCLWAVSKTRLLLYHVSLVSADNLGAFWNYGVGWSPQRHSSGEVPLTPLGTNGWTNIFCCLECWDVCMGLELPPSRPNSYLSCLALPVNVIVLLLTSRWSDSTLNIIHHP